MPHMEQSILKALQDAVVKVFWQKADMRRMLSTNGVPATLINEQDWEQHKHLILSPILDRLNLDIDAWMELMRNAGSFLGGAFGHLAARAREAFRRGAKWIVDVTHGLYREPELTS